MDVPSQHCSSRQELIDFLCGSAGGTRRRGRPTCPTRQPCLPASSEAGECGQTGQRIGQEPARRRLPIAFCKATCAAPADALDIGGSAGYCLIWPGLCGDPAGPCCRTPTWCGHEICFFSALGQQGRCKGSRPATRSRPRWEAAARSCWQWSGHLPARHRGNALAGTRGTNWRRPRPAAAGDRIKVSSEAAGEGRGASAATPLPQPSCVAPVHGGHATHAAL